MIKQIPISSTMFASIGHDGEGTLEVVYKSTNRAYRHAGVTPEQFQALLAADSVGLHFNRHIRSQFPGTLVPQESTVTVDSDEGSR